MYEGKHMAYVEGCDMRGFLTFQILWLLSRKRMHGEGIAKEIERRRGEKPKAGTLYPALKELNSKGLISGEKAGKTITYSLTPEGRAVIADAKRYFVKCFGDILVER
jgi:PadR family transcriptional regulator, regulatory protein PadR